MKIEKIQLFSNQVRPLLDGVPTIQTSYPGTNIELHIAAPKNPNFHIDSGEISAIDLLALLEVILALGNLRKIKIEERIGITGDSSLLSDVFSRCKHLKCFETDVLKFGTQSDFQAFSKGLGKLPSLEFFKLGRFDSVSIGPPTFRLAMDQLANPASVLKKLIIVDEKFAHPNNKAFDVRFLHQFFEACQNSSTLEHLHWEASDLQMRGLQTSDLGAVERLIQKTSSLKTLILGVRGDTNLASLAEAMKGNTTIRKLEFPGELEQSNFRTIPFFRGGLNVGNRLVFPAVVLRSARPALDIAKASEEATAFLTLLEDHNYTLESLRRSPWLRWQKAEGKSPWTKVRNQDATLRDRLPKKSAGLPDEVQTQVARIYLLLQLNKAARGKLAGPTANPNDVINAIIAKNHDLSFVFYYLQQNPALCQLGLPGSN